MGPVAVGLFAPEVRGRVVGALSVAGATQAVGMLGLYAVGTDPVAAVAILVLRGTALGPVFMTTQNEMLQCAPARTYRALAANSGAYSAGIAAGAALGGLILSLADVQGSFLRRRSSDRRDVRGLLGGRLLPRR